MCTRFYIEPETEELMEVIEEIRKSLLKRRFLKAGSAIQTFGEIRPTDVVPVIAPGKDAKRAVFPMRWGFQIPGRSLVVNARSETAAEKPTFQEAWRKHRCVIPASWYYEWEHLTDEAGRKKAGDKFMIQPRNAQVTYLAGLYRMEDGLPVFTVLTREPSEELRKLHDRMPLILPQECIDEWIRPDADPEKLLKYALTDMVTERVE